MLATLGVLAREASNLAEARVRLAEAETLLQQRHDQVVLIGLNWHLALLTRAQGDEGATEQHLRAALSAMRTGGYGTTLLWQPRRFAELCAWGIERGIEATYATALLRSSLASWVGAFDGAQPAEAPGGGDGESVAQARGATLTSRERDVLRLAAQGLRDKQIADRLCLSTRTVQNHLHHCYEKLNVPNRAAAVRLVLEDPRLIDPT